MSGDAVPVDPDRLASGRWDHQLQRYVGEGDITASYSVDRIGLNQPVRKPFRWKRGLWVCTGRMGDRAAEAYKLSPVGAFPSPVTTYIAKTRDSEAARNDPMGFYHGVTVSHGGRPYVLTGPPVQFERGPSSQLELFQAAARDRLGSGR